MVRAASRGALVGIAWGLLARLFMRLLATNPEFSWEGTLMILGFSALLWAGIGAVSAARAAGRSRWWRLLPVPGMLLFAGAGMVLLPGIAGSAAWFALRRSPAVGRRVLGAALGLVGLGATGWAVASDGSVSMSAGVATGMALVVVATVWAGAAFHDWWRGWGNSGAEATGRPTSAAYGRLGVTT